VFTSLRISFLTAAAAVVSPKNDTAAEGVMEEATGSMSSTEPVFRHYMLIVDL
jgi:hypothetical protein